MKYLLTVASFVFAFSANAFERYVIADLVDKIQPAVVNIKAEEGSLKDNATSYKSNPFAKQDKKKALENIYGDANQGIKSKQQYSIGSGVIISQDGYLITNYHVVELAKKIKITTVNNKFYEANVVGFDAKSDLALLKIDTADKLDFVNLDDSNKVRVGEVVVAIGNPYGLDGSVSLGIISARNRNIGTNIYDDFLQTDASINPGNSGGPLFNLDGKIIGINTAIFSKAGGSNGIGFAIPSNTVKLIVKQLKETGKVTRGWLGIQAQQLDSETAKALKLSDTNGVLVSDITPNSPAEAAGVKPGDVIVMYNDVKITSLFDLPKMVAETPIDSKISLEVIRNGVDIKLWTKIISEDEVAKIEKQKDILVRHAKILGFYVAQNNSDLAKEFSLKQDSGVLVTEVEESYKKFNIIGGDIILQIDQKAVSSAEEFINIIKKSNKKSFLLLVNRRGNNIFSVIER
jgi:serine protease Do